MPPAIEVLRRFLRDSAQYLGLTPSPQRWRWLLGQPALPVQRRVSAQERKPMDGR